MRTFGALTGLLALTVTVGAAPQSAAPMFDVVSIKENTSDAGGGGTRPRGNDRWEATNLSLRSLLGAAWNIPSDRVLGGPDWTRTTRYDIDARGSIANGWDDIRPKLQSLLRERFNVAVHIEHRQLPVYYLVKARADAPPGPRLKPSVIDCSASNWRDMAKANPTARACMFSIDNGALTGGGMTMMTLSSILTGAAATPVLDRTGLSGGHDVDLEWSGAFGNTNPDAVSIFTAVQEQLGLKLEGGTAPLDVLIVDHAERPSAN
jgi:uncharacterized protein (TIGR03435 family)